MRSTPAPEVAICLILTEGRYSPPSRLLSLGASDRCCRTVLPAPGRRRVHAQGGGGGSALLHEASSSRNDLRPRRSESRRGRGRSHFRANVGAVPARTWALQCRCSRGRRSATARSACDAQRAARAAPMTRAPAGQGRSLAASPGAVRPTGVRGASLTRRIRGRVFSSARCRRRRSSRGCCAWRATGSRRPLHRRLRVLIIRLRVLIIRFKGTDAVRRGEYADAPLPAVPERRRTDAESTLRVPFRVSVAHAMPWIARNAQSAL